MPDSPMKIRYNKAMDTLDWHISDTYDTEGIRELKAVRELLIELWAAHEEGYVPGCRYNMAYAKANADRATLLAEVDRECEWELMGDNPDAAFVWLPSCRIAATPSDKPPGPFCPYCGGKIKEPTHD